MRLYARMNFLEQNKSFEPKYAECLKDLAQYFGIEGLTEEDIYY